MLWRDSSISDDRQQEADCSLGIFLSLGFVICNVLVVYAIERVVSLEAALLGRTITIAFVSTFIAFKLFYYDESGYGITIIELVAGIILLSGLELFYREPEHEIEVSTNFHPVG